MLYLPFSPSGPSLLSVLAVPKLCRAVQKSTANRDVSRAHTLTRKSFATHWDFDPLGVTGGPSAVCGETSLASLSRQRSRVRVSSSPPFPPKELAPLLENRAIHKKQAATLRFMPWRLSL